jgi:phage terminase large subunit-like protein
MISRKAGKTAFASAIGILCAIADKENGAEVELVANSRQQAKIAFDITSNFCESVDTKGKIFKRYRDTIQIPKTKSKIQVLSSDAMGNDGYNSSCFILDEMHAMKTWDLYNVLISSQGMREQPLAIIITTAGFLLNGYPCYEHRLTCLDILKGNKQDDSQFSAIYELDDGDEWDNEDNWLKCAPSLGQTVSYDYLREQVLAAKNNTALETGVLTKNFNKFCQTKEVWIPDNYLTNAFDKIEIDDLKDEDCYMGVDLSAISDLTAVSVLFPPNEERKMRPDKFIFKNIIYVPESAFEESVNGDLYKIWKRNKYVRVTSGNVVDYDYILKDQLDIYDKTYLLAVGYDSWNATQWAIDATSEGLPLYPYSQAIGNFNRPTKYFEMLLRQGKVIIDYNPCVRWCFNNAELKYDHNNNCKPVKSAGNQDRKIDPIIAMVQALGTYLNKVSPSSDGEVLAVENFSN